MTEATWQPARLIPTSGISGPDEQETRATSALLAVMPVVKEFASALLRPAGAIPGNVETFIEVPLKSAEGTSHRPDGLIRVTKGQRMWTALVEVKTGNNDLARDQVESYLDIAREHDFDAVITISNQIASSPGVHPVDVDKRKVKKVALHHLSWAEILSAAVLQRVHRGVSDPEQAWILAELIRYLEHPRSGALDFTDMGAAWVTVREAVDNGTLRNPNDKGAIEVAARWDQLMRFAVLRLERDLGSGVQMALSRREQNEPGFRQQSVVADLVSKGVLTAALRGPNTVGDLQVCADLRTGRCTVEVELAAPADGRPLTRINWLVRQLGDAHDLVRVDAYAHMARTSASGLLKAVRDDPSILLADPRADIRRFRVGAASALGGKRGVGRGTFIDSVLAAIDGFYETVLQELRPWQPKAPQLPKVGTAVAAAGIDTTVLPEEQSFLPSDTVHDSDAAADPHEVAAEVNVLIDEPSDLVSWDTQEDTLTEERIAGVPENTDLPQPLGERSDNDHGPSARTPDTDYDGDA